MPANSSNGIVFLFDVDNTLLDNDRAKANIEAQLEEILGKEGAGRFWAIYEAVRKDLGVVSYPQTVARFEEEWPDKVQGYRVANVVNGLPYEDYLFPGTVAALEYVSRMGEVAILSDGDGEYQPRKIARAGLAKVVGYDDVLIFTHKQDHLADIMKRLPGTHYVLVDDKETILAKAKELIGDKLTTVWVKQGHYAHDPKEYREPGPDIVLGSIGEICEVSRGAVLGNRG